MSRVSRQDLKTILLCGIHLAKVDDNFHLLEKKFLRRFADGMKLNDDEREDLLAMGSSLAENVDMLTSDFAKELLVKTLCAVSYVDGTASTEEMDFIVKVNESLGVEYPIPPKEEWGGLEEEVFNILARGE